MKYHTKTENSEENVFTKPSGYTSARSPRYIIYTSFTRDFPTQRFLYSFAHVFSVQFFLPSKNPRRNCDGDSDCTDLILISQR